ncbi:hypothetical protein E0Z10_g7017 [Xylaria hypoxylon]|uniref:Uncharacterized protein n=1 Tax=Xylaria hypoxylon TaxID=37992 RepID=A0A4Z0YCP8_9PEZI|nr:hypothetical protein E0Z10_g7017 [Xylaria hypoxylon]
MPLIAEPERQWPPRSPHEVLLSTPGGRERLRRLAERASPSPSPSKRASRPIVNRANSHDLRGIDGEEDGLDLDLEGDEDEETLQLQLAAIQAKLKLKKLQAARAKKAQEPDIPTMRSESRPILDAAPSSRVQSRAGHLKPGPIIQPQAQVDVEVPASPVRRTQTAQDTTSPSRIRLGIDKGLRAKDVSLKRAPSLKKTLDTNKGPQGGYLRRANTPALGASNQSVAQERPKTFSERLAAARTDEKTRQERHERIQQVRTKAFQLNKQEMDELKQNATEMPEILIQEEQYSRDEVMAGSGLKRGNTVPHLQQQTQDEFGEVSGHETIELESDKQQVPPSEVPEEEASAFEPYSSIHLKKRIIPHSTLTRNLSDKKTYVIPDLLKHVKAPEFQLPDVEQDIVVFGILASKSDPRAHKNTGSNIKEKTEADQAKAKYMVLKLVDLKWELELFLFGTGFERYWKLTPGTLLAILNPTIMPPAPGRTDTGRFSLVINSGYDTILEVGTARDLGFCKSIKKDGTLCSSWVNSKRTEFCEFHMNMVLSKKKLARQDINAFNTGLGPKKHGSHRGPSWKAHGNDPSEKQRGSYDRESQGVWFVHKVSAASMLDNEVLGGGYGSAAGTIERSETLRRRLATEEKERNIMKKLGEVGSAPQRTLSLEEPRPQLDAKSLGLIADKNNKIHLSPIKRKRVESALSSRNSSILGSTANSYSASGTAGLGWGGGLKDKLARMKEGQNLHTTNGAANGSENETPSETNKDRNRSPARKKTRFVTEKGIREAGRESLGAELASGSGKGRGMVFLDDDDDDDDLIILK